jgi:hypothetical protein
VNIARPFNNRHPELVSGSIAPPARRYRWQTQPHSQIGPARVIGIDKIDFPLPMPVFQLFFTRYSRRHISEQFIMNKSIDGIFGRVTRRKIVTMLVHALHQIRSHANIKRAIEPTRKDIDARLFFFFHGSSDAAKWTLKQVQGDSFFCCRRRYDAPRHPELISGSISRLIEINKAEI